jgi:hypothetical protein
MKKSLFCAVALALVLLCAIGAAEDTAFTFRTGITWDTTLDDLLAAEGLRIGDAEFRQKQYNGFDFYYVLNPASGSGDAYYIYRGGLPVMVYEPLLKDTKAIPVFDRAAEAYAAGHGAPGELTAADFEALMRIIWPEGITQGSVRRVAGWRLKDGTLAVLFDFQAYNYMGYVHQERLLAAAEETAD